MYQDEKSIQELSVKECLSFLDVWKKFLKSKCKNETQSYASTLCCPPSGWEYSREQTSDSTVK
jgi:hypothetical protein